ncbi:hypothetical protein GCM10009836_20150 [Pseudonocardia ailaonensis]|uniref:Biopolymer transporter Tol n=1 Tax=Pseudonocardia ailaonensis TaxID=367279 RepID=A0ABN2MVX0_9PSEU
MVNGRRWRATDPEIPEEIRDELQRHLGRARSAVRTSRDAGDEEAVKAARHRVDAAKRGLGERGDPWWEQDSATRERRWRAAIEALAER